MLVTLSDMKTLLGIGSGDTSQDTFLTDQLNLASETVEAYCKRNFLEKTFIQTVYQEDVGRVKEFTLFYFPIISIDNFVEKELIADAGTPVANYRFHTPSAKLTSQGRFFSNGKIMEITFKAGYPYASIPAPIKEVVRSIVQERYNKKVNGIDLNFGSDIQRINIPGTISIDYDYSLAGNDRKTPFGNILGNHVNVLDFYRSDRAVVGTVRPAYVQ